MDDKIRPRNFDQICRLCLEYASDENVLFPLFINEANIPGFYGRFAKEFKESIPEVVSTCIGIEIDPTEKLPLKICSTCENKLIKSNQFRLKCLLSNEYLQGLRLSGDDDDFDTDDDTPLSSHKHPELILVDCIKEENEEEEDAEMDSSCASVRDNLESQTTNVEDENVRNETLTVKTEKQSEMKKTAIKRSTTKPLITPSTPIVPVNCNEAIDCRESLSNKDLPKNSIKYHYKKKPKMCTVCGIIVDRLRDHMRIHPDALEYGCTNCPKRYLTKKGLSKHIRIQHTEDSIADPTCAQKTSLEQMKKYRGETYISKNGVVRGAKCIGPVCKQCFFKCPVHISNEHRERLFNTFYNLGNIRKQWEYIARCTERILPKYRRIVENSMRKRRERNLNVSYYFQLDDDRIRVCKTFLMNTLGISNSVIKTALKKCNENGELIVGDRRGVRNKRK